MTGDEIELWKTYRGNGTSDEILEGEERTVWTKTVSGTQKDMERNRSRSYQNIIITIMGEADGRPHHGRQSCMLPHPRP
jgi:hypothetical protein